MDGPLADGVKGVNACQSCTKSNVSAATNRQGTPRTRTIELKTSQGGRTRLSTHGRPPRSSGTARRSCIFAADRRTKLLPGQAPRAISVLSCYLTYIMAYVFHA